MSIFKQFIKESFDREFNYQKIHSNEFGETYKIFISKNKKTFISLELVFIKSKNEIIGYQLIFDLVNDGKISNLTLANYFDAGGLASLINTIANITKKELNTKNGYVVAFSAKDTNENDLLKRTHFYELISKMFARKNNLFWESVNKDNGTIFVLSKKKLTIKKIEKYLK